MERGHYNGYRGRPGLREVLKIAAVLLLVLGVLVAAGLMYAQRYIIYTDDGVRLELPFDRQEPAADKGTASVSVDVIQLPPERSQQP